MYVKQVLYFLFILLWHTTYSQAINYRIYSGDNNEIILAVDSLSCSYENDFSQFYIDSITRIPYNGVVVIKYDASMPASDSIMIQEGVHNGYRKYYSVNKKKEQELYGISYVKPTNEPFSIHRGILKFTTTGKVNFVDTSSNSVIVFLKYKNRRIKLKQTTIFKKTGVKSTKRKVFHSLQDLESYFKCNYIKFYSICQEMSFFTTIVSAPPLVLE